MRANECLLLALIIRKIAKSRFAGIDKRTRGQAESTLRQASGMKKEVSSVALENACCLQKEKIL